MAQLQSVVLLCHLEILVASVKISSLLLQLFGSSSQRGPIILEGNVYLTLLRLFSVSPSSQYSLLSHFLAYALFMGFFFSLSKKLYFDSEQTMGI